MVWTENRHGIDDNGENYTWDVPWGMLSNETCLKIRQMSCRHALTGLMLVYVVYGVGEVQYLSLNGITATGDLNSVRAFIIESFH